MQNIILLAKYLKKDIGCHYKMINSLGLYSDDEYQRARYKSDIAEQKARYLLQYMPENQKQVFSCFVGIIY